MQDERTRYRWADESVASVAWRYIADERGHTLLEATVAVALLMTVLVPLGGTTLYLVTQRHNEDQIVALAIGQRYLEESLHTKDYESEDVRHDDEWRVRRDVDQTRGRVLVRVRVYRRSDPVPYVDLSTVRLL